MRRLAFLCLLAVSAVAQSATIYKYVDKDGHVTFTNVPLRGAQALIIMPSSSPSGSGGITVNNDQAIKPRTQNNSSPANIPRVDSNTQRSRDANRQRILQSELDNERKALAEAQQALADYRKKTGANAAQIQKLQDAVTDRERNIAALNQELGNPGYSK